MNKERLEELRARVFTDCQEWDVKCSKDGFQEASPTGEMDADGKYLTALIDAEIARQSVTDEQIRTALDYVSDYKKEAMEYDTSVGIFPPTSEEVRAWETVETALRQMRTEPCWYCKGIESHGIKSVKTVTDESDRELGAYDTPYNFCPNCGRKMVR